MYQKDS